MFSVLIFIASRFTVWRFCFVTVNDEARGMFTRDYFKGRGIWWRVSRYTTIPAPVKFDPICGKCFYLRLRSLVVPSASDYAANTVNYL